MLLDTAICLVTPLRRGNTDGNSLTLELSEPHGRFAARKAVASSGALSSHVRRSPGLLSPIVRSIPLLSAMPPHAPQLPKLNVEGSSPFGRSTRLACLARVGDVRTCARFHSGRSSAG